MVFPFERMTNFLRPVLAYVVRQVGMLYVLQRSRQYGIFGTDAFARLIFTVNQKSNRMPSRVACIMKKSLPLYRDL